MALHLYIYVDAPADGHDVGVGRGDSGDENS